MDSQQEMFVVLATIQRRFPYENNRADSVLLSVMTYIEKRFDFENNKFEKLCAFNLEHNVSFHNIVDIRKLSDNIECNISVSIIWIQFITNGTFPNFQKIGTFIYSIQHSNAPYKSMFSIMFACCRRERGSQGYCLILMHFIIFLILKREKI